MVKIYHDITLDFAESNSMKTVPIVQGDDEGRVLRVKFKNGGVDVPIGSTQGDAASLYASVRGTVTAMGTYCEIVDADHAVLIPITSTLSALAGVEHCEIRITSANGTIHSAEFDILVQALAATPDMPYVVETADIVGEIEDLGDRVTALENSGGGLSTSVGWAFVACFPEWTTLRLILSPKTTPTIMGDSGYFDLDTTQYQNFDYTYDGMLLYRNNRLVEKPAYNFYPIINGQVTIGETTYTSDVTTGVRVKFTGLVLDSTDTLYVELFIKPEGGSAAYPAAEAIQLLNGVTGSIAANAAPIDDVE